MKVGDRVVPTAEIGTIVQISKNGAIVSVHYDVDDATQDYPSDALAIIVDHRLLGTVRRIIACNNRGLPVHLQKEIAEARAFIESQEK